MPMVQSPLSKTPTNPDGGQRQVKNELGKDEFLKLMIAQLRAQDPLNPTNDQEFIAQMAQFSSLEQMKNVADSMNAMKESQERFLGILTQTQGTGLIGKEIIGTLDLLDEEGKPILDEGGNPKQVQVIGVATEFKTVDGMPMVVVNGVNVALERINQINPGPVSEYQALAQWASMLGKEVTGEVARFDADGKIIKDDKGEPVIDKDVTGRITRYKVVNGQPVFEVTYTLDGAEQKGQLRRANTLG